MDSNECSQCHERENAFICFCQEVLLCQSCLAFHLLTTPAAPHRPVPLSSYQLLKEMQCQSPDHSEDTVTDQRSKLQSELTRLREFRTSAMEQLRQVRQQWLLQINEAANEIEAILTAKCDSMEQDLKQGLENIDGGSLPIFAKGKDADLLNLSFEVGKLDLNPLFKQFFSVSLNYAEAQREDRFMYKLFGGQNLLAVFDTTTESVSAFHNLSERLLHNSCWVLTPDNTLLITGGSIAGQCSSETLKYVVDEKRTERLSSMQVARRSHASLLYDEKLFVFGGIQDETNIADCEALDLKENKWTATSSLRTPRGQLGAVEHEGCAYVAGGCEVAEIEVYDFLSDSWDAIVMPGAWLLEGCSMLAMKESLLILHGNYKGEMFLFQPQTCSLQKLSDLCHGNSWSNCVPVLQGRTLYMLRTDSIFKVNLDTNQSSYVLKITKTAKKRRQESSDS